MTTTTKTPAASRRPRKGTLELRFAEYLDQLGAESPSTTKGERTRSRLKAAAARILGEKGYHAMLIGDVCRRAGLSLGAIYQYFDDKTQLSVEVLTEFSHRNGQLMRALGPFADPYLQIYETNVLYVKLFRDNAGLMRCARQLSDELPEFNALWTRSNAEWSQLIARDLLRKSKATAQSERHAMHLAYGLGAMVDEFLHEAYIRRTPNLASLARTPEELAETISILWYRLAYAANPDDAHFPSGHPFFKFALAAGTARLSKRK